MSRNILTSKLPTAENSRRDLGLGVRHDDPNRPMSATISQDIGQNSQMQELSREPTRMTERLLQEGFDPNVNYSPRFVITGVSPCSVKERLKLLDLKHQT